MDAYYKFFNLKKICEPIGLQTDKLYNNLRGKYKSLTQGDRARIVNTLRAPVIEFFNEMGYDVTISRKQKES